MQGLKGRCTVTVNLSCSAGRVILWMISNTIVRHNINVIVHMYSIDGLVNTVMYGVHVQVFMKVWVWVWICAFNDKWPQ